MVIERIDGFAAFGRQLLEKFQGPGQTPKQGVEAPENTTEFGDARPKASGDTADISPKAHHLIALRHAMDSGHKALEKVPEVRPDRIAEAKSRLNRGYYNSIEVRQRVAERLDVVARKLEDI